MRYILIIIIISLSLNTFAQFHAVYIPEEKLSKMKMDGNMNDWNWMQPADFITTKSFNEFSFNANVDPKNWDCKLAFGWSDVTNRLYIVALVYDNVRIANVITTKDAHWLNDNFEIMVFPTGNTIERSFVQYYFLVPFIDKNEEMNVGIGGKWLKSQLEWGWKILGDRSRPGYTIYEISMPIWDDWNARGIKFSKKHTLSANETIYLSIAANDLDNDKTKVMHWDTSPGRNCFSDPKDLSELTLDPPVSVNRSWNNIAKVLMPY